MLISQTKKFSPPNQLEVNSRFSLPEFGWKSARYWNFRLLFNSFLRKFVLPAKVFHHIKARLICCEGKAIPPTSSSSRSARISPAVYLFIDEAIEQPTVSKPGILETREWRENSFFALFLTPCENLGDCCFLRILTGLHLNLIDDNRDYW